MPQRHLRLATDGADLGRGFARIREELEIPDTFGADVLAEAAACPVLNGPDETALPLVTIDPPGSNDLDQAVLIERLVLQG